MFLNPLLIDEISEFIKGLNIQFNYNSNGDIQKIIGRCQCGKIISELSFFYQDRDKLQACDIFSQGALIFPQSNPADIICANLRYVWDASLPQQIDGILTIINKKKGVTRANLNKKYNFKNQRLISVQAHDETIHEFKYDSQGRLVEEIQEHTIAIEYENNNISRLLFKDDKKVLSNNIFEYINGRIFRSFQILNNRWCLREQYHLDDMPDGTTINDCASHLWLSKDKLVCRVKIGQQSLPAVYRVDVPLLFETEPAILDLHLPENIEIFIRAEDRARIIWKVDGNMCICQTLAFDKAGKLKVITNDPITGFDGYINFPYFQKGSTSDIILNNAKRASDIEVEKS